MKVLVFDYCISVTGHRLHYASLVADAFKDDYEVVLGLPDVIEHEPQVTALSSRSFSTDFFAVRKTTKTKQGFADTLFTASNTRKCLIQMIKRHQPDLVAIPTADGLAVLAGMLDWLPWSPLRRAKIDMCVMRGPQIYPKQPIKQAISNLKWWLVRKGPWQRIMLIDPREWARSGKATKEQVLLCPDPVPPQKFFDRQQARKSLNLPLDGRILVSVGPQNLRKGSDRLLKGFEATDLNDNDRLVMIGRVDNSVAATIQSVKLNDRLIVRNEFVSEDEFQMAIIASDVVAIPYRAVDRPSGIVCRSMAWSRPMVMTNRGWLNWIMEKFDAGFGVDPDDPAKFGETIKLALDQSPQFQTSDKAQEFIDFNTEESYSEIWRRGANYDAADTDQPDSSQTLWS